MARRTYSSKTIALVCATLIFLLTLISNALVFGLAFRDANLDSAFLWVSLGIALLAGFIGYFVLGRTIQRAIYHQLTRLYNNMVPDNPYVPKEETMDMEDLVSEVQDVVAKRKLEIDSLKDLDAFRKEFLGNVAHELKTPLFTVQGYILTLLDGALEDKNINKKYLNRANKGVERLNYIVKDLDLLTQLETGNTALEESHFDIVTLIKNVFELLEIRAQKSKISLEFDREYTKPIEVYADEERIQQVLTNLVMNSIKYGKEKGTTEIRVEPYGQNRIIVRIADNGYGIEKTHIPRLFERFYRVDKSGSRKQGGSGLGLSIVKHIVEAHHEEIFVESQPEIGSQFSFTLKKTALVDSESE